MKIKFLFSPNVIGRAIGTTMRRDRGGEGKREGGRTEHAQGVDDVEGLGAAVYLSDGQGAALGWTDRAKGKGDPVDLILEGEGGREGGRERREW